MKNNQHSRTKLIDEWVSANSTSFKRHIPRTIKEAKRRFKCNKLSGGPCTLEGYSCGKRHLVAVATIRKVESRPDWACKLTSKDDETCARCKAGSVRAKLLKICPTSVKPKKQKQPKAEDRFVLLGENDEHF